jgi:hypothetical protein
VKQLLVTIFLVICYSCQAQARRFLLGNNVGFAAAITVTNTFITNSFITPNSSISNNISPSVNKGYRGFYFTAVSNFSIVALGRWSIDGDTQLHAVVFGTNFSGNSGPGDTIASNYSIQMSASPGFYYTNISPINVIAGGNYFITTDETMADLFYGGNSIVLSYVTNEFRSDIASMGGAAEGRDNNGLFYNLKGTNVSHGPLNFKFTLP